MPTEPDVPAEGISIEEVFERVRALGRENERILADLMAGERRFRQLAKAVWRVQEEERRRLARELHDGLGQKLTALKNQLAWLRRQPGAAPDEELELATRLAGEALDDTRELSRLLRPPVLDDLGLPPALRWIGRTFADRFALTVQVEAPDLSERPAAEVETVIFRIAQEALTNVARHAEAKRVTVRLTADPEWLELEVADDGQGFDAARRLRTTDAGTGVGLRGMQDRVDLFGGRFEVQSTPGHGTVVRARVPVPVSETRR